jgi:hypothetical protein
MPMSEIDPPAQGHVLLENLEDIEHQIRKLTRRRDRIVAECVSAKIEWQAIARAMGRPTQNVRRKYGDPDR